ncbi:MAG: glycosyltransferase [Gemmatimonadota bacterium]
MTRLTILVPVYNGAAFVEETLQHVAAQTVHDFRVLISIDRGDDDSESICRRFASDRRFEIIVQPERRGWVGNVNALISCVDTPFFCITPHDDLLNPQYAEAMLDLLAREPAASCAYSDIVGFGASKGDISQPDVRGERQERVLDVLLNHFDAVAFRAVVRRRDKSDRPYLPSDIPRHFCADTVWMIRLALRGELRRVAQPLYRKRFDAATVHAGWGELPRADLLRLFAAVVAASTRLALEEIDDPVEREEVLTAGLLRASGQGSKRDWDIPDTTLERATVVAHFAHATSDLGTPDDPAAVLARTGSRALRAATQPMLEDPPRPPFARRVAGKIRRLLRGPH